MKKSDIFSVRSLCISAMIAALYAVLTLALPAYGYGEIQFRISEALTLLPILTPAAIPGLTVGCLIANIFSTVSALPDMIFGTLATLIAALLTYRFRKNLWLAALMPVLSNGLIVGTMLYIILGSMSLPVHMGCVAAGEALACYVLGIPLCKLLQKTNIKF